MNRVVKYRLFPTKAQQTKIDAQIEAHRFLYNWALEERRNSYNDHKISIKYKDQAAKIPQLRKDNLDLPQCNYSSLQQTLRRLDKSYSSFFKKISKPPRFKKKGQVSSIEFSKQGNGWKLKESIIYVQGVGDIKFYNHRDIKSPQRLSIYKKNNDYYVCITGTIKENRVCGKGFVGIDLGFKNYVTTSNGESYENPKHLKRSRKNIVRLSKKKNSPKHQKALAKAHEKITNRRNDFLHKLTLDLVRKYKTLIVEDLKVEDLKSCFSNINFALYDLSFGKFLEILTYKAESAGGKVVKVDPAYTTQDCSGCGNREPKKLTDRVHKCEKCGLDIDRDLNAALNILARGLTSLGENP
jgi:putative transposase